MKKYGKQSRLSILFYYLLIIPIALILGLLYCFGRLTSKV